MCQFSYRLLQALWGKKSFQGQCIITLALDCLLLKVEESTVTVYSHGYWCLTIFFQQIIEILVILHTECLSMSLKNHTFLSTPDLHMQRVSYLITQSEHVSAVSTANTISSHFPVSMVTVALDCYCSNSISGNSLQPWSLGGRR